mgnify:CR=1 FL=1
MKKIIPFVIGMFLLMGIVLADPPVPAPITFKVSVNGYPITFDAEVTNTRTGEKLTSNDVGSLRIIRGTGFFDLQEFKSGYQIANPFFNYAGDRLEVRVCDVHPSCSFSLYIKTRDPIQNTYRINIVDTTIPEIRYVEKIKCWDGSEILATQTCPVQPVYYVCSDGTKITDSSLCPKPKEPEPVYDPTVVVAISIVILGLTLIWSLVKNTDLKGQYRWIPGMAGILAKKLEEYKQEKDKERSKKLKQTILKYSVTITEKYLDKIKKN